MFMVQNSGYLVIRSRFEIGEEGDGENLARQFLRRIGSSIGQNLIFVANFQVETCLSYMYKVRNVLTIATYVITLICFGITGPINLINDQNPEIIKIHSCADQEGQTNLRHPPGRQRCQKAETTENQ